jgi:SET domain-containing protein
MLPPPSFNNPFVFVATSIIPDAGNGLFAKTFIPKGMRISDYMGERLLYKEFKDLYGNDKRYIYCCKRQNYIMSGKELPYLTANPSHYCNEDRERTNVEMKRMGLYAIRNILANEELFLVYPKDYPRTW